MSVSQAQFDALELARREKFVANGQSGEITFLKMVSGAQVVHKVVTQAWDYGERDAVGRLLPPNVQYELRVAESLLVAADLKLITGIKIDGVIYQIELPSPFPPQSLRRFYRFWLSPQEDAS
jgi:hypothetical protein